MLQLRYFLETEELEPLDAATLEISDNGGNRWVELASNHGVPLLEDGGGLWKCGAYNISAYAGRDAQIRLTFDSYLAINNHFGGFHVDDIRVAVSYPTLFADGFESGDTAEWSATVAP